MTLPMGVGMAGGQSPVADQCWADVELPFMTAGVPGRGPCKQMAVSPLDLCAAHHREIADPYRWGPT